MRRLLLLRHGEADHPPGTHFGDDSERPLTEEGRRRMAEEAAGLIDLQIMIDAVVTSPYLRTRETAEIVAAACGLAAGVVEAPELQPGAALRDIRHAVRRVTGSSILVVGHAPDLGEAAGELTGRDDLSLGKGWLAWVALPGGDMKRGQGELLAVLPAGVLREAGRRGTRRH